MRLFAFLLAACAFADTPTIQNNDFEMPLIGPPFVSVIAVPGWTHTGATGIGNLCRIGYADGVGNVGGAGSRRHWLRSAEAAREVRYWPATS